MRSFFHFFFRFFTQHFDRRLQKFNFALNSMDFSSAANATRDSMARVTIEQKNACKHRKCTRFAINIFSKQSNNLAKATVIFHYTCFRSIDKATAHQIRVKRKKNGISNDNDNGNHITIFCTEFNFSFTCFSPFVDFFPQTNCNYLHFCNIFFSSFIPFQPNLFHY